MKRRSKKTGSYQKSDEELFITSKGLDRQTDAERKEALEELDKRGFDFEKAEVRIHELRNQSADNDVDEKSPVATFIKHYWALMLSFIAFILLVKSTNDTGASDEQIFSTKNIVILSIGFVFLLVHTVLNSRMKRK